MREPPQSAEQSLHPATRHTGGNSHAAVLHACSSGSTPSSLLLSQALSGAALPFLSKHSRVRVCVPPRHAAEHAPQAETTQYGSLHAESSHNSARGIMSLVQCSRGTRKPREDWQTAVLVRTPPLPQLGLQADHSEVTSRNVSHSAKPHSCSSTLLSEVNGANAWQYSPPAQFHDALIHC